MNIVAHRNRPERFSPGEMARFGLTIVFNTAMLRCNECGCEWEVDLQENGRRPDRYWACPDLYGHHAYYGQHRASS